MQGRRMVFSGQALQDGDVVVSRVHGPVSMLLARHSPTPGEYSHAGVFAYAADGTPMVYHLRDGGGRAMKAKRFLLSHEVIGIYRHRRSDAAAVMGSYLRTWLKRNDIRRVPFKLFPDPDHFDDPPYNCNTFVNALYLGAGLDRPFQQPAPREMTAWDREIGRFIAYDWTRLTSAGAVARNPAFVQVAVWHNPSIDPRSTAGLRGFTDAIRAEVDGGKRLRPQARRTVARVLAGLCGREDAEYATPQAMAMHFNLSDSWSRVSRRLRLAMRREGDAFTEEDAYEFCRRLALTHLDGFFEEPVKPGTPAP
jgi:hypothetical protein